MKLILVCGPWGSGTSAVAGSLAKLGATGFGPYYCPTDERTPNSYELAAFRDLLNVLFSEQRAAPPSPAEVKTALQEFRGRLLNGELGAYDKTSGTPIFLKHPLAALIIPQICETFETRLIYVIRPLQQIEATHKRRNWTGNFGADAARNIYSHMFTVFINHRLPTLLVRYDELTAWPAEHVRKLAAFANLPSSPETTTDAENFIRRSMTPRREGETGSEK